METKDMNVEEIKPTVIERETKIITEVPVEKIVKEEVEVEVIREVAMRANMDNAVSVAEALANFNLEMDNITKNAQNPFFKSSYLDLSAITENVRPILAKNGLSVIQYPITDEEGKISVNTVILHKSGERMEFPGIFVKPSKSGDVQVMGSLISYLKRYSISAILFISGKNEDDDGEGAIARTPQAPKTTKTTAPVRGGRL